MSIVKIREANWENFEPQWMDRITVILEDFAELGAIRAMVVLDEEGNELTEVLIPSGEYDKQIDYEKIASVKQVLSRSFEKELPLYLTEESGNSIILTGFAAEMILVIVYDKTVLSGAVNMRFEKRIRHMRNVHQSRIKRATIV